MLGEQPRSPARCAVRKRRRNTAKSVAMTRSCRDGRDDVADGALDAGGDVRVGLGGQPAGSRRCRRSRNGPCRSAGPAATRRRPRRWANHDRRLLTAKACRRSWTRGPWPRPPWGMRACHRNRRKFLSMLPSVSGCPAGAGEEPVPAGAPGDAGRGSRPVCRAAAGADGHLPVLAALRVADLQHAGVEVDVVDAQQPGFGGTQAAGVDRAEQHRHDQVPERDLRAVAAAVGLGEQGRQFLVGVDVRDVAGGPGQRARGQDVGRHAPAAQPAGQLPHRRGQALQGRRGDCRAAARPRSTPRPRPGWARASPGNSLAAERGEPGQHPLLGVVLVADGTFLGRPAP